MINELLPTLRVLAIPLRTQFRGITVREIAILESPHGPVEFSPFVEYDDREASRWLQCTLEAATHTSWKKYRTEIPMNGTIPESNDKNLITSLVESFGSVETFKIKVGDNLPLDIARIAKVKSLRPQAKVRIDVNGTWSAEKAITSLRAIYENVGDIEYVEQPCATIDEMRQIKTALRVPIKIAADEVVRKAKDPFAIDLSEAADVLVLKVQPMGGIARSIAIAEHHQLPVVVSSALESDIGLKYGVELAQALPELHFDCGLATSHLFDGPGVDVAPERFEWWKNRIMRCATLVESL